MKLVFYFYTLITAPGIIMHELGHLIFCLFSGVKVYKIKLFGFGKKAGYVVHDEPQKFYQGFLISFGPLILNSLTALVLFSLYKPPYLSQTSLLCLWLGFSISLHAIPSDGDATALFNLASHRIWKNPLVSLGYPFILIIYVLNLLKRLHIDVIYTGLLFWLGNIYLKTL